MSNKRLNTRKAKINVPISTHIHLAIENKTNPDEIVNYYITPYELSVDTLQWAMDNNQIT